MIPAKSLILIQPRTGSWDMMSTRFPESLLAVAAVPKQKGYEIYILDQRLDNKWKTTLRELIAKEPVAAGITSMTGEQLGHTAGILKYIKSISSVPTVLGGIHATLMPEQSVMFPYVDILCAGEGDFTLYEIAESLYEKKSLRNVKGIYYKEDGKAVWTGKREQVMDLNILPLPPYELLSLDRYSTFEIGEGRSATVFTSRGCPYRCRFCASTVAYPIWRGFSVDRVMSNIRLLQEKHGISNIYFQDDNLAGSVPRFKELIRRLSGMEKKIRWGTLGIRADAVCKLDKEDLECLVAGGCHNLDIGVETGSPRVNKFIRKDETLETISEANRRLAPYPIKVKYTFIAGFPTETREEVDESVDFAGALTQANKNAYTLFFPFAPVVGTEFYELALKYGFKEPGNLEEWKYLQLDGWLEKYPSWLSKKEVRRLEALSFVSYFANRNVNYKFTGTYLKLLFFLYHPVAKFRFKNKFFFLFVEKYLQKGIFKIKALLEKFFYR